MTNYRRNFVPGGSFFFTVNLANRQTTLLTERIHLLREAFRYTQVHRPFTLEAIVVLPEHLHAIWTLPSGDTDYATGWRLIKTVFSRGVEPNERRSKRRLKKGKRGIWQRRYWEHTLRDDSDFERHCDYIHFNPVKHGYVPAVSDWPYSSFQRFVRLGVYTLEWGGGGQIEGSEFGER